MAEWDFPEIGLRKLADGDRRRFFDGYVSTRPDVRYVYGNTFSRWRPVEGTALNLSLYITNRSVGLFVRGLRGVPHAATLVALKALSGALCAKLGCVELREGCPYLTNFPLAPTDSANWPEAYRLLAEADDRYHEVLAELAGTLG